MRSYTVAQSKAFRGLISDDIVYGLNKHGYGYFTCTFKIDVLQINTIHQLSILWLAICIPAHETGTLLSKLDCLFIGKNRTVFLLIVPLFCSWQYYYFFDPFSLWPSSPVLAARCLLAYRADKSVAEDLASSMHVRLPYLAERRRHHTSTRRRHFLPFLVVKIM